MDRLHAVQQVEPWRDQDPDEDPTHVPTWAVYTFIVAGAILVIYALRKAMEKKGPE